MISVPGTTQTPAAASPSFHVEGRCHDGTAAVLGAFFTREEADEEHTRFVFGDYPQYAAYRVVTA